MELVSLVGMAILVTIACAILMIGFMLTPWLMLLGLIGLLLLVLWRFPAKEWQPQTQEMPSDGSPDPAAVKPAAPQQLTYRGVPCAPPAQSTNAIEVVESSGKYRGNPWKSSPTHRKSAD